MVKKTSLIISMIVFSILISGCININDNNSKEKNRFLGINEVVSIYETWESGFYNLVLFNDKTVSFIYSGIQIYNNGTRNLSNDEIQYILSLSNITSISNGENGYLSDYKKISDASFNEIYGLINEKNINELSGFYLGNDTYDSDGSDVFISFFDHNATIMFYDDGYHYEKDLTTLVEIRAILKNEMENVWK